MPEYLAPGVYIEEVSTGARPIEGVSTSTTGFAGPTERGPLMPRLVTSWEEYVRWYGDYVDRVPGRKAFYLPYAARGFFDNGGQRLFIARVTAETAKAAAIEVDALGLQAVGPGIWGNNVLYRIKKASLQKDNSPTQDWFRLTLLYYRDGIPANFLDPTDIDNFGKPDRKDPDVIEDFDNLSITPADTNFGQSIVNGASKLVKVTKLAGTVTLAEPFDGNQKLTGGDDAGEPIDTDYKGRSIPPIDPNEPTDPNKKSGLLGLEAIRDISILAIPDDVVVTSLQTVVINQCEKLKDRFAIISAPPADLIKDPGDATLRPPQDSTYAAYYLPWVRVTASHTAEGHILVPPTGHIAGIYARVDVERGVHKAPANEVVRGIITRDLSGDEKPLSVTLSKQQQDLLNPKGVNVIRDFRSDGRGIRVWGARTMSSDAMWKYINVRRLFIFVEQSIDRGTQWSVFEPNYESTWIAIRLSISAFLRTVWHNGALAGVTQDEAFFVRCDRTTMTQDDWDNGRLICLIGIAPVKPAEFVIFRISQKTVEAQQQ